MKATIYLIVLINGEVMRWCDTSAEAAWEANIDYVMEEIDYIEDTGEACIMGVEA